MSNISFIFWAMGFQEKMLLRFTDLYLHQKESSKQLFSKTFFFHQPSNHLTISQLQEALNNLNSKKDLDKLGTFFLLTSTQDFLQVWITNSDVIYEWTPEDEVQVRSSCRDDGNGEGRGAYTPPPDFGKSVNPISTVGSRLRPPHYYSLPPPDFQTFRHPCHEWWRTQNLL